ncbi:phosphonate ABC transporter ATP-binding protein [Aestuariivirga sp.]|uniref:phosphonate ABC transporter ATP-binding protein n=1 Tax=Aestuariivirga sp. TaxID=2650926 RepID=UPI003593C99B
MNLQVQTFEPAAGSIPAAISIRNLSKSFSASKTVFSGITLDIAPGSLVALIGANGAGKSTLLRCIPRLIEPDGGDIEVQGQMVPRDGRSLRRIRSKIGFVFQKHNLVGRLSSLTNVIHGAQGRGYGAAAWSHAFAPSGIRAEALDCLDRVGLAHAAGQRADSLSGGQSQRVAIARALMQQPDIVLADEPAASLDPQAGDEVMQLFAALMRKEAKTVVFTSHNLHHALQFADRVIAIGGGKVVLDAPSRSLGETELRGLYG